MKSVRDYRSNWSGGAKVPALDAAHWNLMAIPAAALVVMAILQAFSYGKFRDLLDGIRIGWPGGTAVLIIIAEVWGAISLLRVPMNALFRWVGLMLAILVSGFWFIENLYLTTSTGGALPNSGYFGRYLAQNPGWWTVVEVSILLFWVVYGAELMKWRLSER